MAQGACHSDALEVTRLVDDTFDADYCVQSDQFTRHGRVRQIDLARPQRRYDLGWQSVQINLEANGERSRRIHRLDDFVHSQHVCPQLLVAERIEAEDHLAITVMHIRSGHSMSGSAVYGLWRLSASRIRESHCDDVDD